MFKRKIRVYVTYVFAFMTFGVVPVIVPAQATKIRMEPFEVAVPRVKLDRIKQRVRDYPWQEITATEGWGYGASPKFMRDLAAYWQNGYDWRKHEGEINRFKHYTTEINGERLHFLVEKGSGRNPQPLLLLHGYPYSFYSFVDVIEPLAHPEQFGGNAEDGFDVIVPSLPGHGFSAKPQQPIGTREIGRRMNRLMTEVLGYNRYIVHAGDWGGIIAAQMSYDFPSNVKGLHTTTPEMLPESISRAVEQNRIESLTSLSEEERAHLAEMQRRRNGNDFAYWKLQSSRPQTINIGLTDSPVGAAAWIIEKWYLWSDRRARSFEQIMSRDRLSTEVMIYLINNNLNTATELYAGFARNDTFTVPDGKRIEAPTGVAAFVEPLAKVPPRRLAERAYNIVQWADMPRGGHFPFVEEPKLLVDEVRKLGRLVR